MGQVAGEEPGRPVALTIAGSDSAAGAGVAADLKTFESYGVWGALAITAVTAQNTMGVQHVSILAPEVVAAQIVSVVSDLQVGGVKTGMLGDGAVVRAVASTLRAHATGPLVVDPVMASGHGEALLDPSGVRALRDELLPLASVVTPNVMEASTLAARPVDSRGAMVEAAEAIAAMGPPVVMITGGHLDDRGSSPDLLWHSGAPEWLEAARIPTRHTHGTGCVLSAAVAAGLALGAGPAEACRRAKTFVNRAIAAGPLLGRGTRPVDPGWARGAGRS